MKGIIKVTEEERNFIHEALSTPKSEDDMVLDPYTTFTRSYDFGNDIVMDIKICGVEFEEGTDNTPYTEAVLFKDGCEVACTDPDDAFFGEWGLEYDGDLYEVEVIW